jgi:hypothetical protein
MPLWSLTEERVLDLEEQMNKKKDEHGNLEKTHCHELWDTDLAKMLAVLDTVET